MRGQDMRVSGIMLRKGRFTVEDRPRVLELRQSFAPPYSGGAPVSRQQRLKTRIDQREMLFGSSFVSKRTPKKDPGGGARRGQYLGGRGRSRELICTSAASSKTTLQMDVCS